MRGQIGLIVFLVIALLVVSGLFVFFLLRPNLTLYTTSQSMDDCYDVTIPYTTTEQYIDQEPYTVVESVRRDFNYRSDGSYTSVVQGSQIRIQGHVEVKNLEQYSGDFTVTMYFSTDKTSVTREKTKRIDGRDTESFDIDVNILGTHDVRWRYTVEPERDDFSRSVTLTRDVVKLKDVVRYRTEQKCY